MKWWAAPPGQWGGPQRPHSLKEVEGNTPRPRAEALVDAALGQPGWSPSLGPWREEAGGGGGGSGESWALRRCPLSLWCPCSRASQNSGLQLWAAEAVTPATALFRKGHLPCGWAASRLAVQVSVCTTNRGADSRPGICGPWPGVLGSPGAPSLGTVSPSSCELWEAPPAVGPGRVEGVTPASAELHAGSVPTWSPADASRTSPLDPGLALRGEAPALSCRRAELRFERVCVMGPVDLLSSFQKLSGAGGSGIRPETGRASWGRCCSRALGGSIGLAKVGFRKPFLTPPGCVLPYFGPGSGEGLGLSYVSVGYSEAQGWPSCPQSHRLFVQPGGGARSPGALAPPSCPCGLDQRPFQSWRQDRLG